MPRPSQQYSRWLTMRIWPVTVAVGLVLAAVLGHFIYHFPPDLIGAVRAFGLQFQGDWQFPVHGAMAVLTMGVMWFSAAGVGHALLYRFGGAGTLPSLWARWVFAVLTGWVVLSLAIFGVGLAGFCSREGLGLLLLVAAACAVYGWKVHWRESSLPLTPLREERAAREYEFTGWVLALAATLYLIALPYAIAPSVESDELRYHLAAPQAYLAAGRIHYLSHQAFSNFPFLIEMLYTMAMALQGTEAAKLIHFSFLESSAILTGLLTFLLIRLSFGRLRWATARAARNFAAIAGCAFASIPSVTILACWAFVDLAMIAYFLAVVYAGTLCLTARRPLPAWLLGLMVAGSIGTKYSMAPLMIAVAGLLILISLTLRNRNGDRKKFSAKYFATAGLTASLFASPWFIRNWIWTSNPFYPLAYGRFGGGDWSPENAAFYAAKAAEKGFPMRALYNELLRHGINSSWLTGPFEKVIAFLISPVTTSLAPRYFEDHFFGPMPLMAMTLMIGGLTIVLAGLMLSRRERSRHPLKNEWAGSRRMAVGLWMAGLIIGTWLFWFLTYQSNRLLLPTVALVFAGGGWGMMMLLARAPSRVVSRGLTGLVAAAVVYSLCFTDAVIYGPNRNPIAVAFGFERRDDYLSRHIAYYRSAKWLAPRATDQTKALLIGEHRTLYFPAAIISSDWFDTPQPLPWIRQTNNNDELLDRLKQNGVRYIFFNRGELLKYRAPYYEPRMQPIEYARAEALVGIESGRPHPRLALVHRDDAADIFIYEIDGKREGASDANADGK